MSVISKEQLLLELHRLGVQLRSDGEQLFIQAPRGTVTADLREALKEHKESLLAALCPVAAAPNQARDQVPQPDDIAAHLRQRLQALPGMLRVDVEAVAQDANGWLARVTLDPEATGCTTRTHMGTQDEAHLDRRWRQLVSAGHALAARLREEHSALLHEHARVCDALNRLSTVSMALTLCARGRFQEAETPETAPSIVKDLGLRPRQLTIISQWLETMERAGYVRAHASGYLRTDALDACELQREIQVLHSSITSDGAYAPFVDHIKACALAQSDLLSGSKDPFELLFPQGSFDVAYAHYRDNPVVRINNHLLAQLSAIVIDSRRGSSVPKVLELGAGSGATTEAVLERLHGREAHYLFTDIGEFFLRRAAQKFGHSQAPRLSCHLLDLASSPFLQGFEPQSVDLLIAVNVVHNAVHIEQTLAQLRRLMAPGGVLLLSEQTENSPLNQINFAHFESFGHYRDRRVRRNSPLMSADEWHQAFDASGFVRFASFPADPVPEPDPGRQRVMVAEAPSCRHRFDAESWLGVARQSVRDLDASVTFSIVEPRSPGVAAGPASPESRQIHRETP